MLEYVHQLCVALSLDDAVRACHGDVAAGLAFSEVEQIGQGTQAGD